MFNFEDFDIDLKTGFMPGMPLPLLGKPWNAWEDLLQDAMSRPLPLDEEGGSTNPRAEKWRAAVREAPQLEVNDLEASKPLLRRSFTVLALLTHTYAHSQKSRPGHGTTIPSSIGIPFLNVAKKLEVPPVLSAHAALLNNWRPKNPKEPMSETNFMSLSPFTGTPDEAKFFSTHLSIELRGVKALHLIRELMTEAYNPSTESKAIMTEKLKKLADIISQLTAILADIRDGCQPSVFYNVLRPWMGGPSLDSPWIFEKAEENGFDQPGPMSGTTAAQSALFYSIDLMLGIDEATSGYTNPFRQGMKAYMPPGHRAFLDYLSGQPRVVREFVMKAKDDSLTRAFDLCVERLKEAKNEHIRIVTLYIISPARAKGGNASVKGTGGSNPLPYLKESRDRTAESLIRMK